MKNPFRQSWSAFCYWQAFRKYPGVFRLRDALLQFMRIVVPARWNHAFAGRQMARHVSVSDVAQVPGVYLVHCHRLDVGFFWNVKVDNNMFFMVEQEFNPQNPHCYNTLPIRLEKTRHIFDVGACEGLFAFRMAKQCPESVIHCFEPFAEMAALIRQGAELNRVQAQVKVEALAVGKAAGYVRFVASDSPDAGAVVSCAASDKNALLATTLDRYVSDHDIRLSEHDLIKIDAEGADLDVLKGSEQLIRRFRPQIAVTTYHKDEHPEEIYTWLRDLDVGYRFRLKGFSFWTEKPRPVLLQASTLDDK